MSTPAPGRLIGPQEELLLLPPQRVATTCALQPPVTAVPGLLPLTRAARGPQQLLVQKWLLLLPQLMSDPHFPRSPSNQGGVFSLCINTLLILLSSSFAYSHGGVSVAPADNHCWVPALLSQCLNVPFPLTRPPGGGLLLYNCSQVLATLLKK